MAVDVDLTVINVDFAGSPNTVDVSARVDARAGNVAQKITGTTRTLTFDIRYKTNATFAYTAGTDDQLIYVLKQVESSLDEIAIAIVDQGSGTNGAVGTIGVNGSMGFVGNFTVSLGYTQELNGLVTVPVTAAFSSFGEPVHYDGTTANEWVLIS